MTGRWFVDTNVLVYSRDDTEPVRRPVARAWLSVLWAERRGRTSVQVLNEYFSTVTRKLSPGMPSEAAWALVRQLSAWRPATQTEGTLFRAKAIADRYELNWWDCLVVAAAQGQACEYLLTEDLQDGQDLGGVLTVDPFVHSPAEFG